MAKYEREREREGGPSLYCKQKEAEMNDDTCLVGMTQL